MPRITGCNLRFLAFWSCAGLSLALSVASTILVTVWMNNYYDGFEWNDKRKFNFHPLFMTVAFAGFLPQATLVFRGFPTAPRLFVKLVHFLLQLLAIPFAVAGLTAVVEYHNEFGFDNFYSVHSWCGLATIGLFTLQLVGGFLSFLFPKLPDDLRAKVAKLHVIMGTYILFLAFLTTISGISRTTSFSKLSSLKGEQILTNCLTIVLLLLLGLVLFLLRSKTNSTDYESL